MYDTHVSRGSLPPDVYDTIGARLPDVLTLRHTALSLAPDWLSMKFPPGHQAPEAAVCFHDCTSVMSDIRHALFEYFAHRHYYREFRQPPDELVAVAMERFYLDDACLRLYAAGESLATAVILMLDVNRTLMNEYRDAKTSEKSALAAYLRAHAADHVLTHPLFQLHELPEGRFTMTYRNRWVHEQPPTIAGDGVTYRRGARRKYDGDGNPAYLAMTTGDAPELTIDVLAANVMRANEAFVSVVTRALAHYLAIVDAQGFIGSPAGASPLLFSSKVFASA